MPPCDNCAGCTMTSPAMVHRRGSAIEEIVLMPRLRLLPLLLVIAVLMAFAPAARPLAAQPTNPELILATTTSTQDSGLLDVLVPLFERQSGYHVKTISVG